MPLGARPSLQGGIGHLARLHGLASDSIIGAVVVSVESSHVLYVGHIPKQHWPVGAVRPEDHKDLLWAIKGAGTNFGIVISVTFKGYQAPNYHFSYSCFSRSIPAREANGRVAMRMINLHETGGAQTSLWLNAGATYFATIRSRL
ncbi:uncharacterized protein RAG0_03173 [Rhynchosporium agropyri]|uniref:Uncharacterized protein n=1 Tax=Rhynchosporium agropyri TaxID=914238 RepID=A0A1E1K356_9HELO|nr:uncharacterized protein RAG0_03173 [Rhynchosporium agropyri]